MLLVRVVAPQRGLNGGALVFETSRALYPLRKGRSACSALWCRQCGRPLSVLCTVLQGVRLGSPALFRGWDPKGRIMHRNGVQGHQGGSVHLTHRLVLDCAQEEPQHRLQMRRHEAGSRGPHLVIDELDGEDRLGAAVAREGPFWCLVGHPRLDRPLRDRGEKTSLDPRVPLGTTAGSTVSTFV